MLLLQKMQCCLHLNIVLEQMLLSFFKISEFRVGWVCRVYLVLFKPGLVK